MSFQLNCPQWYVKWVVLKPQIGGLNLKLIIQSGYKHLSSAYQEVFLLTPLKKTELATWVQQAKHAPLEEFQLDIETLVSLL